MYSVAHAFPTYAGQVPLTGEQARRCSLQHVHAPGRSGAVVVAGGAGPRLPGSRAGAGRPPAAPCPSLIRCKPAEYGTQEGVPNKLYFVPHAKAHARGGRWPAPLACSPHAQRCRSQLAPALKALPCCTASLPPSPALPAQALIFYKSFKAGVLLGVEQGAGFVIARRVPPAPCPRACKLGALCCAATAAKHWPTHLLHERLRRRAAKPHRPPV